MTVRALTYAQPDSGTPARCVLMESDGTEHCTYESTRSWWGISHHGRMFRLAGRDRQTGDMIYLPEETSAA